LRFVIAANAERCAFESTPMEGRILRAGKEEHEGNEDKKKGKMEWSLIDGSGKSNC